MHRFSKNVGVSRRMALRRLQNEGLPQTARVQREVNIRTQRSQRQTEFTEGSNSVGRHFKMTITH